MLDFCGLTLALGHYRCGDPNLLDLPVSIESVDRSFYHVAFFTNRIVECGEELTWDYGLNFKTEDRSMFPCHCLSSMCRDTSVLRLPLAVGKSPKKPATIRWLGTYSTREVYLYKTWTNQDVKIYVSIKECPYLSYLHLPVSSGKNLWYSF